MIIFHIIFKSVIRHGSLRSFVLIPSHTIHCETIEGGNVGFDVEQRSFVQHIHASNQKTIVFNAEKSNGRETNRIGTGRSARRKYPMFFIFQIRSDLHHGS